MTDTFGQGAYAVRLDWGPTGAAHTSGDVSVVVDVLSFSTSVTVAAERGMRVYPYRWKGDQAQAFADDHDALLAVGRLEAGKEGGIVAPSLSPAALAECEPIPRLVLPSPNGSTIATELLNHGSTVVAGCLRNARAVAAWLGSALAEGCSVAVIAAGERWPQDDTLRVALEDQLGAGAILSHLRGNVPVEDFSPEASAAEMMFDAAVGSLAELMRRCVGGRELTEKGFAADVEVAAELNVSTVVPVLRDGAFTAG